MSKIILFPFWPSPKGLFVSFSVSHSFHKNHIFFAKKIMKTCCQFKKNDYLCEQVRKNKV